MHRMQLMTTTCKRSFLAHCQGLPTPTLHTISASVAQEQAEGKPAKRQKQGSKQDAAGKKAAAKPRPAAVADKENSGAANAAAQQGAVPFAAPKSRLEERPLAALTHK